MPQDQRPRDRSSWDVDRAFTYSGVGPLAGPGALVPPQANHSGYRLGQRVGRSGQVFEAENARFAGRLVVKLFPFATGLPASAADGFTVEATQVAQLRHPHIAQVVDAGALADGTPFVAMERLAGSTLAERISDGEAMPVHVLLPLLRGIVSALSVAHATGIVHGELRADNVFVASLTGYELGFAKLLDFGVAHLTAAAQAAGRIVGAGQGRYMAPEQRPGSLERIDERTDQFALGALTTRLLTGSDPVSAPDGGPGFERIGTRGSSAAASFLRGAPAVDAVLAKAMSRRPEHRFDSVALFFRAFEDALAGAPQAQAPLPVRAESAPHAAEAAGATTASPVPAGAKVHKPAPTRRIVRSVAGEVRESDTDRRSLTEQFFAEGDRQEARRWEGSPLVRGDEQRADPREIFESFDRVPRRRAPFVAAVALITATVAMLAWARGWRPPLDWLAPIASRGSGPLASHDVVPPPDPLVSAPPVAAPEAAEAPAGPAVAVAPSSSAGPAAGLAVPSAASLPSSPAGPAGGPAPALGSVSPKTAGSAPAPTPQEPSPTHEAANPGTDAPGASRRDGPEGARGALAGAPRLAGRGPSITDAPGRPGGGGLPSKPRVDGHREPLRGYAWSPEHGRLTSVGPASAPPSSEPPPSQGLPPVPQAPSAP